MSKYIIDNSDPEVAELRNKCRSVRDRIAKIGMAVPTSSHPTKPLQPELPTDSGFDYSIIIEKEENRNAATNLQNRVSRV